MPALYRIPLILLVLAVFLPVPFSTAAQNPDLAQHVTNIDGRITADIPADWLVHTGVPNVLILASNDAALAAALGEGDFPADGAVIGIAGPRPGVSPASVLTGFNMQQQLTGEGVLDFDTYWLGYAETSTLVDFPADRVETESERTQGVLLSVDFGWTSLLVTADWARDSDQADVVAAVLDTIRYTPREEPLHYVTPDAALGFAYAGDWHVEHRTDGIMLWNNPSGPGEAFLWFPPREWYAYPGAEMEPAEAAASLMENHYVRTGGDTGGQVSRFDSVQIAEPRPVQINGVDGVQIDYTWGGGGGYVLALDYERRVLALAVTIYEGSVDDYAAALDTVTESLRFPAYDNTYDLDTLRQTWSRSETDAYRISVHFRDAIWAERTHTVTVRDGVVVGHEVVCVLPPSDPCDPLVFDPYAYTVPGLFMLAAEVEARAAQSDSLRITVAHNVDYYYPARISFSEAEVTDSDRAWEVVAFDVLE